MRGFFTDHHAVLLRIMLANIDRLTEQASLLDAEIEQVISPFSVRRPSSMKSPEWARWPPRSSSPTSVSR
ncbi:hypothetical protein [Nonomuraea fuscirosea]|uniref:hypothetical protein n=1 Tax=Nonomuraea fuscirosea TaxID=1291556 RepID=UPI001C6302FA|nr:hypothetical protein [Nonomuraea fuscirosea]